MFNYIKRKFFGSGSDSATASEKFYSPLRIALHSTISVNTVDWLVVQPNLSEVFSIPQGNMEVLAIGQMKFDDMNIYRVYVRDETRNEYVLQILCSPNFRTGDEEVNEVLLLEQTLAAHPDTEESWDEWMANMGLKTFEWYENTYDRLWGDNHSEQSDLVKFDEHIITPTNETDYQDHYMLYSRDVDSVTSSEPVTEFALIGIEESDNDAEVTISIGLNVNIQSISVQ